jgi:hypothetical protein
VELAFFGLGCIKFLGPGSLEIKGVTKHKPSATVDRSFGEYLFDET